MVAEFPRRRLLAYEALSDMNGIRISESRGAFYALPIVSQLPLVPMELSRNFLDEAKIAVVPWGESHIRLSYANSYENLQKAMHRMKQAIKRLKASNRPAKHRNPNDATAAEYS
jgi:aminotransferase